MSSSLLLPGALQLACNLRTVLILYSTLRIGGVGVYRCARGKNMTSILSSLKDNTLCKNCILLCRTLKQQHGYLAVYIVKLWNAGMCMQYHILMYCWAVLQTIFKTLPGKSCNRGSTYIIHAPFIGPCRKSVIGDWLYIWHVKCSLHDQSAAWKLLSTLS